MYRPLVNGVQWPHQSIGHPNIDRNESRREFVVDSVVTDRNSANDVVHRLAEAFSHLTVSQKIIGGMDAFVTGQQFWRVEVQVKTFDDYLGPG